LKLNKVKLEEINAELSEAIEEHQEREMLEQHLSFLGQHRKDLKRDIFKLKNILDKEKEEYDILNTENLVNLFMQVLGTMEKKKEKERQDFVHAAMEYNGALDQLQILEYEEDLLQQKLDELPKTRIKLDEIIAFKQAFLKKSDLLQGSIIAKYDLQIHNLQKKLRVIEKLRTSGDEITTHLNLILQHLNEFKISTRGSYPRSKRIGYRQKKLLRRVSKLCTNTQVKMHLYADNMEQLNLGDKIFEKKPMYGFLKNLEYSVVLDWVHSYFFKKSTDTIQEWKTKLETYKTDVMDERAIVYQNKIEELKEEKMDFLMNV